MIEVIYKEEKQETKDEEGLFSIPRNIRQIGLVGGNYRIYIEDYVYTFLGRMAGAEHVQEKECGCLAVLVGDTKWNNGATYLFIRGALRVEDAEANPDHIDFSEKIWAKIHEEQEKYFPGKEIVGWFFAKEQMPVEVNELFAKVHLRHFGGEKVLMLMEPMEREDAFFCYENNLMVKQRGYYIYYEKNPEMQEYMLERNQGLMPQLTEEVEDEAVKTFRKIVQNKNRKKNERKDGEEEQETEGHTSVFSYAATACLVIAVLAVGANVFRNYRSVRGIGEAVQTVTGVTSSKDTKPETLLKPTATPKPTATVTPVPVPTEVPKTDDSAAEPSPAALEEETGSTEVYREESDARKARRREALGEQDSVAQTSGGDTSAAQITEENSETGAADPNQADVQAQNTEQGEIPQGNSQEASDGQDVQETDEAQTTAGNELHETYVIRPGDTLYQISIARYGNMDAISEICRLNGLAENEIIYPGQVIVLP